MYAVILAGGGGTRLWPLSDPQHPKPFLPLFPDGSLLQKTVRRLTEGDELGLTVDDLTVVTDRRYEGLVREQLPDVAVLSEPVGRNTAPAIALAVLAIERDPDEVMVILPADHLVGDERLFRAVLADARDELAEGGLGIESPIVTLGAQPSGPTTHYGYLVPDPARQQWHPYRLHSYVLQEFVEKPDAARAKELLNVPDCSWNAGIFMARRRAFLAALERYTDLVGTLREAVPSPEALEAAYANITPISIDYAVMQPAAVEGQVVMAGMDVGWSDVGTWRALLDALVGGYQGAARVVPAGEALGLEVADLAVRRTDDAVLVLERGSAELSSPRPMGFLPDAGQHEQALSRLIARVNERLAMAAEVRA